MKDLEIEAQEILADKNIKQYALIVSKNVKCHLSQQKASQSTVGNVIQNTRNFKITKIILKNELTFFSLFNFIRF